MRPDAARDPSLVRLASRSSDAGPRHDDGRGRYRSCSAASAPALAAAGLGAHLIWGTWWWPTAWCGDRSDRRAGARRADGDSAALALQRGVVIAVGVSFPVAVLWLFTE
jgi:hypothetical protein